MWRLLFWRAQSVLWKQDNLNCSFEVENFFVIEPNQCPRSTYSLPKLFVYSIDKYELVMLCSEQPCKGFRRWLVLESNGRPTHQPVWGPGFPRSLRKTCYSVSVWAWSQLIWTLLEGNMRGQKNWIAAELFHAFPISPKGMFLYPLPV